MAAKQNRSSKAKQNGFAGIPKKDHLIVKMYIATSAVKGKKISPQNAWMRIQAADAKDAAEQDSKTKEKELVRKREATEMAKAAIEPAIIKLASVRDLLQGLDRGEVEYINHDAPMFAHAALKEAACQIEQAAFTLGLLPKQKAKREGWFVERFN